VDDPFESQAVQEMNTWSQSIVAARSSNVFCVVRWKLSLS
jgi:hypothetical protein